jgi:hypothetical protein
LAEILQGLNLIFKYNKLFINHFNLLKKVFMKKITTILLSLLIAVAFSACVKPKPTMVMVKNACDFQLNDIILFCFQGEDQVDQKSIGSLGAGSISQATEISEKIEKVSVSIKFPGNSTRYITVTKFLIKSNEENTLTIDGNTYIKPYSDSKGSDEGVPIIRLLE